MAARRPWLKSFLTTMRSFVTSNVDNEDIEDDNVDKSFIFLNNILSISQGAENKCTNIFYVSLTTTSFIDRGLRTNAKTSPLSTFPSTRRPLQMSASATLTSE